MKNIRIFAGILFLVFVTIGCRQTPDKKLTSQSQTPDYNIPISTLEDVELKSQVITELIDSIKTGLYPNRHSLLIYKDDKLVLEEYFSGLIKDDLEDIEKNKTVIILDGDVPLRDHYLVIPTSSMLDLIGDYCKGGYKRVDPMAYMKTMMRKGFPYNIVGTEPSHISFVYKMG